MLALTLAQHINGAAFYSLREPELAGLVDQVLASLEADHHYRLGLNSTAREFPYDAALYLAFSQLMRTDYPRYRRNAHRMQCVWPRITAPFVAARNCCPLRADTAVVRSLGRAESQQLDPPHAAALHRFSQEYPETFLVHARQSVRSSEPLTADAICESWCPGDSRAWGLKCTWRRCAACQPCPRRPHTHVPSGSRVPSQRPGGAREISTCSANMLEP